jgi:hypothetical protein
MNRQLQMNEMIRCSVLLSIAAKTVTDVKLEHLHPTTEINAKIANSYLASDLAEPCLQSCRRNENPFNLQEVDR